MSDFRSVEENMDYKKDAASGVVLNDNEAEYNNARMRAGKSKIQEKRLTNMETDISTIMQMLKDIKNA